MVHLLANSDLIFLRNGGFFLKNKLTSTFRKTDGIPNSTKSHKFWCFPFGTFLPKMDILWIQTTFKKNQEDNVLRKNNCIKIATNQMMRETPEIPTIVRTLWSRRHFNGIITISEMSSSYGYISVRYYTVPWKSVKTYSMIKQNKVSKM